MADSTFEDLDALPGADLYAVGARDLQAGRTTAAAAVVSMAAPRLRAIGLEVPDAVLDDPGHLLYHLLSEEDRRPAHSRYNARVGRSARA